MPPQLTARLQLQPHRYVTSIRSYRIKAGLTQSAIARQLGVTRKTVSAWERGLSCPIPPLLMQLARALSTLAEHLYPAYFWPESTKR
jgi:DNA-binding XRE family transcriptional regulator